MIPRNLPNKLKWISASIVLACLIPGMSTHAAPVADVSLLGPKTDVIRLQEYGDVFHVSTTLGNDSDGDGSSTHPWASIERALDAASAATGNHRLAVLVAEGTYGNDTIVCRENVDLFGGYSAKDWSRDIFRHSSVIDGKGAHRAVVGANHSRIDGFVIKDGRILGNGGGMLCDNTSPEISNNRFIGNHALSPANIRKERIHQSGNRGGALAALFDAAPVVRNNIFLDNWTEFGDGGAIGLYGWSRLDGRPQPLVKHNVFLGNRSGVKDVFRTRSSNGGAISCAHEMNATICENLFAQNQAMGRSDAGAIFIEYYSMPEILNNWIIGNIGDDDGGAIYSMRDGEPLVQGNIIAGNWTTGGGVGGIRLSKEGRMRIIQNVIVKNVTGGGLLLVDGLAVVENNIIADNKEGYGIVYRQNWNHFQPTRIVGNVIYGNESGEISVEDHQGVDPVVEANRDHPISGDFDAEGFTLGINGVSFDPVYCRSSLKVTGQPLKKNLVGRVVHSGLVWSVITSVSNSSVEVWGDFSQVNNQLEIIPDYNVKQ